MRERRVGGAAGLVLALASRLLPRRVREAWRREWEGEIDAARREGRPVTSLVLGAVADARASAQVTRAADRASAVSRQGRRSGMALDEALRELRRAARSLVRAPGFTLPSVATLGVGLASVAALFTLVDAILLRPLPYPGADRLVSVYHTMEVPGSAGIEWPLTQHGYAHLRDGTRAFEAWGGHGSPRQVALAGEEGAAERVTAVTATPGLWEILGARAAVGRLFGEAEARRDAPPVAVLGHGLWLRRYGGDPGVVGRSVRVQGQAVEVLGVMAPDVHLPTRRVDLWTPQVVDLASSPTDEFRIHVVARLRPEQDAAAAAADADAVGARLDEVAPFFAVYRDQLRLRTHVRSVRQQVVGGVERTLWLVLGAVGIVLLVAVANVANLFLVRTEGRRGEVAVRAALGARRWDLLAHFLGESALVAAAAAALGVAGAWAGVRVLTALAPPSIPRLDELAVGASTLALTAGLAVVVAGLLGLYPFARFAGGRGSAPGSRGSRGPGHGEAAAGGVLVVAQVALALVLLASSALLFRSFQNLRSVDPGFRSEGVLVADLSLPSDRYGSDVEAYGFLREVEERVRALPGVEAVAFGPSPIDGPLGCSGVVVEGVVLAEDELGPCSPMAQVTAEYFELLDMEVVRGRAFTAADAVERARVAVVTRNLAERYWPGGDPLGRGFRPASQRSEYFRVVGVVEPVRGAGLHAPPPELIYFTPLMPDPFRWPLRGGRVMVRTDPERAAGLSAALRRVVADLDPEVPVSVAGTLEEELARSMVRTSFTLVLLGTAASMALVLGLVGLYGVVAYQVGTRRAEFGIRMAMGARATDVRNMVLRHSLRLVAAGTALGLGAALLLTRLLESLLHDVRPGDPWLLAAAALTLLATAGAASWIPAQRATRVDPAATLRSE